MSRIQHNPQYEPISCDQSPNYPMWEITSEARKQDYATGAEEMKPPPSGPSIPSGGPAPGNHTVSSRSPSTISRFLRDWWVTEIVSWLFALVSMAIMLHFLKKHDQRPQSDWPFPITVNAFLQVFTTILRGALLVPVAQSISQLKWTWFLSCDRSLDDFATFEDASRGTWGSLRLIWHQKATRLASLGALITILTLATSTFVQQAVSYPIRPTMSRNGTAMVGINTFYSDIEGVFDATTAQAYPASAMKGALYSGLLGNYWNTIQPSAPVCSTGNCTWPLYSSLGICSSVADLTASINVNSNDGTFTLPNGNQIDNFSDFITIRITDDLNANWEAQSWPTYNITSIAFRNVQNPIADFTVISTEDESDTAVAVECLLQYCVQTFNTTVVDGIYNTTVVKSQTAASLGITLPPFGDELSYGGVDSSTMMLSVPSSSGNVSYGSPVDTILALQIWLGAKLPGYIDVDQYIITSDSVSTFSAAAQTSNYIASIGNLMENIATTMTNEIRTSSGSINIHGTAYENIAYINVNWDWLTFPIALLVLSLIFLVATVVKSQFSSVGIWKGSTVATMQILKEDTRRELGPLSSSSRMTQVAKSKKVRLRNVAGVWNI